VNSSRALRYAIIINPVSGNMSVEEKLEALSEVGRILGAEIYGTGTRTPEEFRSCARELAEHSDVLATAGGDGTLHEIINTIDTTRTPIAYLPLGCGNAMRHALNYKGGLDSIAQRIKGAHIQEYDLVGCEKSLAFNASVGLEGKVIQLRNRYLEAGATGFLPYLRAVVNACFRKYKRAFARISLDNRHFEIQEMLSLMVTKHPFYGYGMNVVPRASFADGRLHVLFVSSGFVLSTFGAITAFFAANRVGRYRTARNLTVTLDRPLLLQMDGNLAWESDTFSFRVLPGALKIKC